MSVRLSVFLMTVGNQNIIGLIMVFDAILTSKQTRLEITVFVWKSEVK